MAERISGSEVLAHFEHFGQPRALSAGEALFFEADPSRAVYFVSEGLMRVEKTTASGRVVLLDLAGPGDVIGELGVAQTVPRSAAAWAVRDTELSEVPADRFVSELRSNPKLAFEVLTNTAGRLGELTFQLVEAATASAASRVAARLVRLTEMAGLDDGDTECIDLRLPITQQDLGDWAGLSREGVVGGLGTLRESGIIATGRQRVTIHDWDTLGRYAAGLL